MKLEWREMKLKKKLIVIACITLVIIASVDAAENDASEKKASKKKKKSKKVKNVQADDASQVQNQQPAYPEYPDNYDYNDNDYEEPENGGPSKRILPLPVFTFSRFRRRSRKSVEYVELFGFLSLYALISCIFP